MDQAAPGDFFGLWLWDLESDLDDRGRFGLLDQLELGTRTEAGCAKGDGQVDLLLLVPGYC